MTLGMDGITGGMYDHSRQQADRLRAQADAMEVGMEEMQCKEEGRHEAHKWQTWSGADVWCSGNWRPALMDDLAVLRLHLEDDLIHDTQAGEAFARVVGALDLTAEEETWLEEQ